MLNKDGSSPTLTSKHLIPIVCKFCKPPDRLATYNEFDLVLHLSEVHGIGRGYLDTQSTDDIDMKMTTHSDNFNRN
jgi:hypothetical protein